VPDAANFSHSYRPHASPPTVCPPPSLPHNQHFPCPSHPNPYGWRLADRPTILGRRQSTKSSQLHVAHVVHSPPQVGSRSASGRVLVVYRLIKANLRTFIHLLLLQMVRSPSHTFQSYFRLLRANITVLFSPSSSTCLTSHRLLLSRESSCISDTAAPCLRRRVGLSPAVPSSSSSFHFPPPSSSLLCIEYWTLTVSNSHI